MLRIKTLRKALSALMAAAVAAVGIGLNAEIFSAKNTVSAAILGDLNSDGIVNADDVNVLQNYLIKKSGELSDISLDLNNDNTVSWRLKRVKTVDFGTLFDLVYSIELKNDVDQKKFIDSIRTLNGNLNVTLILYKYDDQIYAK